MGGSERRTAARRRDIAATLLVSFSLLSLVSLHSSAVGVVGEAVAFGLRQSVGQAADLPPLIALIGAATLFRSRRVSGQRRKSVAVLLLFTVIVTMLQIVHENRQPPQSTFGLTPPAEAVGGGAIGAWLASLVVGAFGEWGSAIVLITLALVSAILFADVPFVLVVQSCLVLVFSSARSLVTSLTRAITNLLGAATSTVGRWRDSWSIRRAQRSVKRAQHRDAVKETGEEGNQPHVFVDPMRLPFKKGAKSTPTTQVASAKEDTLEMQPVEQPKKRRKKATEKSASAVEDEPELSVTPRLEARTGPPPEYELPPLALLDRPKLKRRSASQPDQRALLEETLETFGVEAKVVSVSRGPAVTRYELQPGPGVAVKRITSLADDLALNLAAAGVRIEAPVPGKSVVGIEVPSKEATLVTFREVVESEVFARARSKVTIAVGVDIAGNAVVGDLTRWLHLLIAGATGSGKSVCINTIICSLLLRAKPNEVKLLLVDPKRVELAVYDGVPHLIAPVVTDPKLASGALRWAVREMESRYKLFADDGVRNIDGYNRLVLERDPLAEALPYVVVIIDELADLMMVAKAEVEDSICRLAQMARAAGMYLIVATQRPSVDVITGLIKANVPSRISFAVSSGVDSRTILDQIGAERLLGKGDMLYHPIGTPKPIRAQGAFISDREVGALVDFWKTQGAPEYQEEVLSEPRADAESPLSEETDELFGDACRLVVETGTASISMVQRRFRVGYARAARLIDMMELRGIVGPYQGSKPREVLRTMDELEEMAL